MEGEMDSELGLLKMDILGLNRWPSEGAVCSWDLNVCSIGQERLVEWYLLIICVHYSMENPGCSELCALWAFCMYSKLTQTTFKLCIFSNDYLYCLLDFITLANIIHSHYIHECIHSCIYSCTKLRPITEYIRMILITQQTEYLAYTLW